MTKMEFLQKLREALENDLTGPIVQENINYYDKYISEEVQKGTSEAVVLTALGDPWMIARTIIDTPGSGTQSQNVYYEESADDYQSQRQTGYEDAPKSTMHVFGLDTWWKKLLLVLVIVMVVVAVVAIITGVISLIAPILVPVLIVMIIVRAIGRRS